MELFPLQNKAKSLLLIPMFNTTIINYGNRVEQRLCNDPLPRYKFQVTFVEALFAADIAVVMNFFVARRGSYEAFHFPHIGSQDGSTFFDYDVDSAASDSDPENDMYTVRFETDLINIDFFQYNLATFQTVNFIEVKA